LSGYTSSYTPSTNGVELSTGKIRHSFPITSFSTRKLGFDFHLHHASLVDYNGPFGKGGSHSFNMMLIQDGPNAGRIVTPDLRVYEIASGDGTVWNLPDGFFSELRLDAEQRQWTLTHFSGLKVEFFAAPVGIPGRPTAIREPNGNTTALNYNADGLLVQIRTDLGQVQTLAYDADTCRLASFTDHIGRRWLFGYDQFGNLETIASPAIEYANVPVGELITDSDFPTVLVNQPRVTTLTHDDPNFANHVTDIVDPRGATPLGYEYDDDGRIRTALINGLPQRYAYEVESDSSASPAALSVLDEGNSVIRVTDREGNVADTEIHGAAHVGHHGIRRRVIWTEHGLGNQPLREGEPAYWEQRWRQDCECLAPAGISQPWSSDDVANLTFDANGMPQNWPRTIFTYNQNRQAVETLYTDGTETIRTTRTFQEFSYGINDQYARMTSRTDPRFFDDHPLYGDLNFTHQYEYDSRGNQVTHTAPTATLGVEDPQPMVESWTYNEHGQHLSHTDANKNITRFNYHEGPSSGGDINTKGTFGGYPAAVTRGAAGSSDGALNLVTRTHVNALGMTTRRTDPRGFNYTYEYNQAGDLIRTAEPAVTLRNNETVQYETVYTYDGARNNLLTGRTNIDVDGSVPDNEFIDRSYAYDDIGNLLAERVEVDENDSNDLITQYAYDRNDQQTVAQQPEGNRRFYVYDERKQPLKTFHGVAPGLNIDSGYPADKRAANLGSTSFIALTRETYDARGNNIISTDGRGNNTRRFFDFNNRMVAAVDPNGNGSASKYDDASNVLSQEGGEISDTDGSVVSVLTRTYYRYDERNRKYLTALDANLGTDEDTDLHPSDGGNSVFSVGYDAGARTIRTNDANGNPTVYSYDSADRQLTTRDALGNTTVQEYDENSNVVRVTRNEVAGPGSSGDPESYVTTVIYDKLNRSTETHVLGLNGNSIDHVNRTSYDSRNNRRLNVDAEGNGTLYTYDDNDRTVRVQRFNGDPLASGASPVVLQHTEHFYDRNSRRTADIAYSEVLNPETAQITLYAHDDLDRRIRTVYPDSDDPIDGSSNGVDGVFDRQEYTYDPNSNLVQATDQRGVEIANTYDPGNRLERQDLDISDTSVAPGSTTRNQFRYDVLNRLTHAANNFTLVTRSYDALSRLISEIQEIKLDGTGEIQVDGATVTHNYEQPVEVQHAYDQQSNDTGCIVVHGTDTDLTISKEIDSLNRVAGIDAAYFGQTQHDIVDYHYFGPGRIQTKTLGNGAQLKNTFDVKHRLASHIWRDTESAVLVGFEYSDAAGNGYDRVDNGLYERFLHDNNLYDHYVYNDRYELVGVDYRSGDPDRPVITGTTYAYDDNYNRTAASFGDPFNADPNTEDTYVSNPVNEYTQLTRDEAPLNPAYDRAGNMTRIPTRPVTGIEVQSDVLAIARWDATNCLFDIDTETVNGTQHYRYDPFRRRVVTLNSTSDLEGSRRYIYDGWSVCEERLFIPDATLANAPSRLERIYVEGQRIDEHLLVAIDRDGDGQLGGTDSKNQRDIEADQEYYYLCNRLGHTMALLDSDFSERIIEYYKYSAYGEPTALPVVEGLGAVEVTPGDLGDNFAMGVRSFSEEFGNPYLFTGRRFDELSGLHHFRNRYFDSRTGRFVHRDPAGAVDSLNLSQYALNRPQTFRDPSGLWIAHEGGKARRIYEKEEGDNWRDLAWWLGLDVHEKDQWAIHVSGNCYSVPNTVYVDWGQLKNHEQGFRGFWSRPNIWREIQVALDAATTDYQARGMLVINSDQVTRSTILLHLADANLRAYVFGGHGATGQINTGRGGIETLEPGHYTQFGIADMQLWSCESLMPTDPASIFASGAVGQRFDGQVVWRTNVSSIGTLKGFTGFAYRFWWPNATLRGGLKYKPSFETPRER
jgi:RHS repeat-associated protein